MSPVLILSLIGLAFLLGPSAFILLWLVWRRTGEDSLRLLALSILGLCLILAGNGASSLLDSVFGLHDNRIFFVIMNGVFMATVMTGAFMNLFVYRSVRRPVGNRLQAVFWIFTILVFFLVLSLPIFIDQNGSVDLTRGYLTATCYGTVCQAWATAVFWRHRQRLPALHRLGPALALVLLGMGILSVINDILKVGVLLGGAMFPFSPFFFILTAGTIAVFCARELLRPEPAAAVAGPVSAEAAPGAAAQLSLSSREAEILPLILEGLSNEEIGQRLFISSHTVKNHVTNIYKKAGVSGRFELLARLKG